eukprot:NODE_6418_length_1674_cov_4.365223.p1 GENE.NODE_6418_length_1674_cov_4.365223~~NODE_6418_length_1674_cov_4.365223.p1  ORF type:complete len:386 (-),score=120.39 NODE_6418_length_1674_cov_4.365223:394-1551(-)
MLATENSLVISRHGLSTDALITLVRELVGEAVRCSPLVGNAPSAGCADGGGSTDVGDTYLIELFLENEVEIAQARLEAQLPGVVIRQATVGDLVCEANAAAASVSTQVVRVGDPALCRTRGAAVGGNRDDDSCLGEHGEGRMDGDDGMRCCCISATITVLRGDGGGTGAKVWSGGVLLAEWLARGAELNERGKTTSLDLRGQAMLELGAGIAALPSLAAAGLGAARVVASDGVACIVEQLAANIAQSDTAVEACVLDWSAAGQSTWSLAERYDVVLFADCIYTERGALLFADAATSLLRPGGLIVGALPDFRVGLRSLEDDLRARGFGARPARLRPEVLAAASRRELRATPDLVAGGSLEGYRIVVWQERASTPTSQRFTKARPD